MHFLELYYDKIMIVLFTPTSKHLQATDGDSKNAKKKNNKKTSKNKSGLSRANKKKPGMPNVSNDLSQKLYATMEKHKEVRFTGRVAFLVVHTHTHARADDFHCKRGCEAQKSPPGSLCLICSEKEGNTLVLLLIMPPLLWSLLHSFAVGLLTSLSPD